MTRQPMTTCPKDDTLRLIWFDNRTVPHICLYVDYYPEHHGWWSIDPDIGGMSPVWKEPREWASIPSS